MMEEGGYDASKSDPPPSYDGGSYSQTQTTTTSSSAPAGIGVRKEYLTTIPAILKIIQILSSLACLICSGFMYQIGGWCGFVCGTAFFCSLIWFILYLVNLSARFPPFTAIVELVYYCVLSVFYLIAFLLACIWASKFTNTPANGAYAFFSVIASVVFIIDAVFQIKRWRSGQYNQSTTHTTTTTTSTEVRY